jgi:hypothetical protein
MKRIFNLLKEISFAFVFGAIASLVLGLSMVLAVASFIQTPLYSFLVTAFFVPFNYADLKRAFLQRQWVAIFVRVTSLLVISGFIFGLIRFASGYGHFAPYMGWTLVGVVPLLFILITTYGVCAVLLPKDSNFHSTLDNIAQQFRDAVRLSF